MQKQFYVRKGIGKTSNKAYTAICLDLGYRTMWLSYKATDCAEALGVSVAELYAMDDGIYPINT